MNARIIPRGTWVAVVPENFYLEGNKFAKSKPMFYYTTEPVLFQALLDDAIAAGIGRAIRFSSFGEALASKLQGKALDISVSGQVHFDGLAGEVTQ